MTTQGKCARCHRREDCPLLDLALRTLPWIVEALESPGSDWDRATAVRRALRGVGGAPGFVDDWLFEGAITSEDAAVMLDDILRAGAASLSALSASCRHYVGPAIAA